MMRVAPASSPPVVAVAELRRHRLADGLAGEAVGDELFEVVADLDAHLALLRPRRRSARRCPCPLADAAAAVLEHLHARTRGCRAYGWNVWTVATTTTSPVACCSARIRRRARARSPASITLAKSLTGAVSAGGGGCAEPRQAQAATSDRPTGDEPASAPARRPHASCTASAYVSTHFRHASRRISVGVVRMPLQRSTSARAVPPRQVARQQRRRIGDGRVGRAGDLRRRSRR